MSDSSRESTAFLMLKSLGIVGGASASMVTGATVLPIMAAQLPSLGLIAAAGAVSGGFFLVFKIPYILLKSILNPNFPENHPILNVLLDCFVETGLWIASTAAASAVLHQAFVPLLVSHLVGSAIITGGVFGLALICALVGGVCFSLCNNDSKDNQGYFAR